MASVWPRHLPMMKSLPSAESAARIAHASAMACPEGDAQCDLDLRLLRLVASLVSEVGSPLGAHFAVSFICLSLSNDNATLTRTHRIAHPIPPPAGPTPRDPTRPRLPSAPTQPNPTQLNLTPSHPKPTQSNRTEPHPTPSHPIQLHSQCTTLRGCILFPAASAAWWPLPSSVPATST